MQNRLKRYYKEIVAFFTEDLTNVFEMLKHTYKNTIWGAKPKAGVVWEHQRQKKHCIMLFLLKNIPVLSESVLPSTI
jgi:hypothetical protein